MKTKISQLGLGLIFLLSGTSVFAQMSGTYTIDANGSGSRNYTTMTAAVSALYNAGISAPVEFEIADGNYSGTYLNFSAQITGASATNTVTFTGNTKDRSKVVFTSTSTYAVRLYGVDYVHFESITFKASSSYCLYFYTNADYNSFRNCDFSGGTSYQAYVYQSEYNEFINCNFEGGDQGIRVYGWSTSQLTRGTKIIGCNVSKASSYNLYAYYTSELQIEDCHFNRGGAYNMYLRYTYDAKINRNLSDETDYTMYSYYSVRSEVTNNEFYGGAMYWAYENYTNYGVATDTSIFANNCIYSSGTQAYGWYPYNCWQTKFYHNSLDVTGTSYGTYMYYPQGSIVQNNNWKSVGSSYGAYVYFTPTASPPKVFSHNNLDWSSNQSFGVLMNYGFGNFNTLKNYAAVSAYTDGVINVPADFESTSNLRSYSPDLNNMGVTINEAFVAKDIDGNSRPASGDSQFDMGVNDYYLHPYDLDIKALINPLSVLMTANDVTVSLKNAGRDTLPSQTISLRYRINQGSWVTESVKISALAPGKSFNFTFSQTWTPTAAGDYNLEVEIDKQVSNDPDKADVRDWDICTAIAGTFTVGSKTADFATLSDAVHALRCGLSGPVVLNLLPGVYTDQAVFEGEILRSSSTNTVTIDGGHPDSVTVQFSAISASTSGTFELNGVGHVHIKNMTIRSMSTSYGFTIHVYNGAHDNSVVNCRILNSGATSTNTAGIALCGSSYSASTIAYDNTFENNQILGHCIGITNYGISGLLTSKNNQFISNVIDDYYNYGVRVYYNYQLVFDNNKILNSRYSSPYPLYVAYNGGSVYQNNEVGDYYAYQMYWLYENIYSQSDTTLFQNNLFYGESNYTSSTYAYGTFVQYPYNCKIYHNTFRYKDQSLPTSATGVNLGGALKIYNAYKLDLQNNIFESVHNSSYGVPLVLSNINSWVAMDGNNFIHPGGIIANVDGTNLNSLSDLMASFPGTNEHSISETVYYAGTNDLHLSAIKRNPRGTPIGVLTDVDGDNRCTISPSIGADESQFPEPKTRAFFAVDDTLFVNAISLFSNQAQEADALSHKWYIDGSLVDDVLDLEYKFASSGTFTVSLISEGCGGMDSFGRTIYVGLPTSKPKADFQLSKSVVDPDEVIQVTNTTTGGADSFYWKVDSYWVWNPDGYIDLSHEYLKGTDTNSLNPYLTFKFPGTYTICLYAYNLRGADSTCKTHEIFVRSNSQMCSQENVSTNLRGKLLDEGGLGSYSANTKCDFLINPCTDEINFTINSFDLGVGSYLRIYDGRDATGIPLHTYDAKFQNGLTDSLTAAGFKTNFTAYSGEVYFEFESGSAVGSGYEIVWNSNVINPLAPSVSFDLPDTACVDIPFTINNTSTGQDVDFKWVMDTAASSWFEESDYETEHVTHTYTKTGKYYVKLVGANCGGGDSLVKIINVVKPSKAPTPAFSVSNSKPAIGDEVVLSDQSTFGSYPCIATWEWSISPNTYRFAQGSSQFDMNPVVTFSDTGCYIITLKVGNQAGTSTYTHQCAVNPYSVCIPTVKSPGSGIGITRVAFSNLENTSEIGSTGYQDFSTTLMAAKLEKGASYDITIDGVNNPASPVNRAVWIDFDKDGLFDNSELVVASQADQNKSWTGNFAIPVKVTAGNTRIRVAMNMGSFKQYGCGPNQFGEYEDYMVEIGEDSQPPVVYYNGARDTTIEQCSNWSDPGAYAIDNVNGTLLNPSAVFGSVDPSQPGTYSVDYRFKDSLGNEGSGIRTVRVIADKTAPVLTLLGNNPDTLEVFSAYLELGATAVDNCIGNVTSDVTSGNNIDTSVTGKYVVTYTVTDLEGNQTTATREVYVVDTQAPTIVLNGSDSVFVEVKNPYTELGATATDNYAANPAVTMDGAVNIYVLGTYFIKYSATDNDNNTSIEIERKVVVGDTTKPTLRLPNGADTLVLDVLDVAYAEEDLIISDNYYDASQIESTVAVFGTYASTFGMGNPATDLGVYTAIYTANDGSGNAASVTRYIKVVDRVAPQFTFDDGAVVTLARWENYTDPGVTATDNYYSASELTVTSTGSFDKNSAGTYQIEYCVEDPSGNKNCAVKTILVQETKQTLSVSEADAISASIYPNPTSGNLTIEVNLQEVSRLRVSVINSLGQEVVQLVDETTDHIQVSNDLSHLNSGVYYVQMISGSQRLVKKITITD